MWLLRAPANNPKRFSGKYLGTEFKNGIALVSNPFELKLLVRSGCEVIPNAELEETRKQRAIASILVTRFGGFGDALIITPAIAALRKKYPHSVIDFYGSEEANTALLNNPHINLFHKEAPHFYAAYASNYDLTFDLSFSIENNPEAEYKNVYDIACEWVDAAPDSKLPQFFPFPQEKENAEQFLTEKGVSLGRDTLIALHFDPTALTRRLEFDKVITIANALGQKGYKVVLLGKDGYGYRRVTLKTPCCNTTIRFDYPNPERIPYLQLKCPSCSQQWGHTVAGFHSNVIYMGYMETGWRFQATLISFCKLFVGCDSGFSAVAASFKTSMILLYAAFDPYLYAKYYENLSLIYRPIKCGPCHQLSGKCVRYPDWIPPCMQQYAPEEILIKIDQVLENGSEKLSLVSLPYQSKQVRNCPICDKRDFELLTRKGNFYHVQCKRCDTIYTDRLPEIEETHYDETYSQYLTGQGVETRNRNFMHFLDNMVVNEYNLERGRFLDVGCDRGFSVDEMKKLGWDAEGIDVNETAIVEAKKLCGDKVWVENIEESKWFEEVKKSKGLKYALINVCHTNEHFYYPVKTFKNLVAMLETKGIIAIAAPNADGWKLERNSWFHINTQVAGEHTNILNLKGWNKLAERLGLKILKYSITETKGDHIIILGRSKYGIDR